MSRNIIKSICWDITSRCNEYCDFCYRNPDNKDLSLSSNENILRKLIDFGVDKISFVGGEPLLYEELFELVKFGKSYTSNPPLFSITTNATLLTNIIDGHMNIDEKIMRKVLDIFDWVTFSLDAPNQEIQSLMGRNARHFERILMLLEYMNDVNIQNKIKINTVVSAINADYMIELYMLLCKYNVKRWKIFRFLPSRGSAFENRAKYYISTECFLEKVRQICSINNNNKIKISVNGYEDFDNSYITISSEGKLIVYENGCYTARVDLQRENSDEILKYIDIDGHIRNRSDFLKI